MRTLAGLLCALALDACTPGADHPLPNPTSAPATTTIDVNLTLHPAASIAAGSSGGFAPASAIVMLGSSVRFVNSDGFAHTATALGVSGTFPAASPLGTNALNQFGALLSQGWTSGTLQAGAASQSLLADQRGTYLYGCFFHYGAPMRAAIVVQ